MSDVDQNRERPAGVARRRILGGIGASGLAAAVAVFGRSSPAAAHYYHYGCCHLRRNNNMSMSACMTSPNENEWYYVWYCAYTASLDCSCCEHYRYSWNNAVGSAYQCYPT